MPYTCRRCNREFRIKRSWIKHMLLHTRGKPYSCNICDKPFNLLASLRTHSRVHTGRRLYSCNTCRKKFNDMSNLRRHKLIHTGVKPYTCDLCDKAFRYKVDMNNHVLSHSREKPYLCKRCDKVFLTKRYLVTHLLIHTASAIEPNSSNIENIDDIDLRSHMSNVTGKKSIIFEICDKVVNRRLASLPNHLNIDNPIKPYTCSKCHEAFYSKRGLKEHFVSAYSCRSRYKPIPTETNFPTFSVDNVAREPFSCNRCDKVFNNKDSLNIHTLVYTGKKTYYFKIIDKAFAESIALESPLLMKAQGISYSCDVCNKTFSHESNLTNHIVLHSVVYIKRNRRIV